MIALMLVYTIYGQKTTLTLDSCVKLATQNYPLIQQYDLLEKSKEYNLSNASKIYLPQFSATIIAGLVDGLPAFSNDPMNPPSQGAEFNLISLLQLNQVIWDGGQTKARKEVINTQNELSKTEVEVNSYEIKRRVQEIYFGLLLLESQNAQLELLLETLNSNFQRVQSAYKNGVAYQSDIDEISVELLNAQQRLTELEFAEGAYLTMLSFLTGTQLDLNTEFERPDITPFILNVENNRPEIAGFENQRKLIEAQNRIHKASLYPNLGLMGVGLFITPGAEFGPSTLDRILVGGVSLSWNIVGLYRNSNNNELMTLNQQMVSVQEEVFRFSVDLQTTKLQEELKKYETLLMQDAQMIELRNRLRKSYEVKYENGVTTLSELIRRINDESLAIQTQKIHELQRLQTYYNFNLETGN